MLHFILLLSFFSITTHASAVDTQTSNDFKLKPRSSRTYEQLEAIAAIYIQRTGLSTSPSDIDPHWRQIDSPLANECFNTDLKQTRRHSLSSLDGRRNSQRLLAFRNFTSPTSTGNITVLPWDKASN
jgi:hypothetical protein